jgi:uncharacterized protein (DUF433 family)
VAVAPRWSHETGLYPLREAARLAQVHRCTARLWIGRGDGNRSLQLPRHIGVGIIQPPNDRDRLLTFAELLTLRLVKRLRAEGFSRLTIRHVTARTAARFGSRTPLVMQRFRTEGTRVLLELETAGRGIARPDAPRTASDPGEMEALQHFFTGILERSLFRNVDWENGAPARWWPMGRARSVLIDPRILAGAPHIAGTPCTTARIAKTAPMAGGDEVAAAVHGVSIQQVRDAVRFEAARPLLL